MRLPFTRGKRRQAGDNGGLEIVDQCKEPDPGRKGACQLSGRRLDICSTLRENVQYQDSS
jgi:hypothetical protein